MKKKFFRYDYNLKITLINIILCVICLVICIFVYDITILFVMLISVGFLAGLNSIFIFNHGIHINYKRGKIYILDDFLLRKLDVRNVKWFSYSIINKGKKSNFKGLFIEFYNPSTYMTNSEYVYNEGVVLEFIFHLTDGTSLKSYYGWMYREKNKKSIEKQIHKIKNFIELYRVNRNC